MHIVVPLKPLKLRRPYSGPVRSCWARLFNLGIQSKGHWMKLRNGLLAAVAGLAFAFPASAQTAEDFDEGRAWLPDEPLFDAFYPETYESLEDALDDRRVSDETPLLVLQRDGTTLTLVTMQMSYHHIAQGDLAGEPWMVSF